MDGPNWAKLEESLGLTELAKGFVRKAPARTVKIVQFAKQWKKINEKVPGEHTVNFDYTLEGEDTRIFQKFILVYEFYKKRGDMPLSWPDFLKRALMIGCLETVTHGDALYAKAEYFRKYIKEARENADELRKSLQDAIDGTGEFAEYTE
jgi:hypothetical protein